MDRPERTRARKAVQSTSTFLAMGEVSYLPEVIHGALSGISIIAGDHLGVFVLPLAPVGLVFALKLGTGGSAQATGEFDGEGDSVFIVWAARVMFAHFGLGFDADFLFRISHLRAQNSLMASWGMLRRASQQANSRTAKQSSVTTRS